MISVTVSQHITIVLNYFFCFILWVIQQTVFVIVSFVLQAERNGHVTATSNNLGTSEEKAGIFSRFPCLKLSMCLHDCNGILRRGRWNQLAAL